MSQDNNSPGATPSLKWKKPKILLMDLPQDVERVLQAEGYNAVAGSFGKPYRVKMDGKLSPLLVEPQLPNYMEQEVVIIDLLLREVGDGGEGEPQQSLDQLNWWVAHTQEVVDPRPRIMVSVQNVFDRCLEHGGCIVIFSQPRRRNKFLFGHLKYGGVEIEHEIPFDNWSFSSLLDEEHLEINDDCGAELRAEDSDNVLHAFARRHADVMCYGATFRPNWRLSQADAGEFVFHTLYTTKYGSAAGGIIVDPQQKGIVIVLPQCSDREKENVVVDLLRNVLPEMSPHLFPHIEGGRWVFSSPYEHESVLALRRQQETCRLQADTQIQELDEQIKEERDRLGYLHGILTKKGAPLVADVKIALEKLGFSHVIDADEQLNEGAPKQEDLQIRDKSPLLLAEVKGIAGFPREGDTFQVVKYIPRRMKQWKRTDISGVVIINHQCNLPALERDDDKVFTDQQIEDAEHQDVTLLTTWELFRLLRGQQQWNWPCDAVKSLFYGKGRIAPAPANYHRVGVVAHFYDKASVASIQIDEGRTMRIGDTVGYVLRDKYFQEVVQSLQVDNVAVSEAYGGQRAGIETSLPRNALPDGTVVYVVD